MKKLIALILLGSSMLFQAPVVFADDLVDSAQPFADIKSRGHCYTDVDGEGVCDYVTVTTSFEPISDVNEYINFVIPYLGYSDLMDQYEPTNRSKMTFYDDDMEVLLTVPLTVDEIPVWTREDYFILYLEDDIFGVGTVPTDLAFFNLTLIYQFGEPQDQARIPEGFTQFLKDYIVYEIDDEIGATESVLMDTSAATAYFYFDFEIYAIVPMEETGVHDLTYAPWFEPPTPRLSGYVYNGWYTSDGGLYNFGDFVEVEEYAPSRVHFYAGLSPVAPIGEDAELAAEGDIITNVLTMIGFNNDAGRVIIFALIALVVMVALAGLKMPMFVGALVVIVIATGFIFLGWLPTYAFILISMASVALMFISLKRGETS
jgi:hypothetical protein